MSNRSFCVVLGALPFLFCGITASGQSLPPLLSTSAVATQDADREEIAHPYAGLLLTPHGMQKDTDEKYHQRYHAACYVYIADDTVGTPAPSSYKRRFIVHAPEAEALPLTKRVGRLLLLLYGLNSSRLHTDHAFNQTVDVWLSGQNAPGATPDAGGEQFKNQIYLYNIFAERRPIEWTREIAHEYGHYILPGVSGFTKPEEWANGVLGERLFLKWIAEGEQTGQIKPDDVPFARPDDVADYVAKQVSPLVRRIAREGISESALAKRDANAMDFYTGLAAYVDTVHGTAALANSLAFTEPKTGTTFVQAPDFLRGVQNSLLGSTEVSYTCPLPAKDGKADFWVYVPRGEYTITPEGSAKSWVFATDARGIHPLSGKNVLINYGQWRKLTLHFPDNATEPARLTLRKKINGD